MWLLWQLIGACNVGGRAEIEQCRWDPTECTDYNSYIVRMNVEFQKLGARGATVRGWYWACPGTWVCVLGRSVVPAAEYPRAYLWMWVRVCLAAGGLGW